MSYSNYYLFLINGERRDEVGVKGNRLILNHSEQSYGSVLCVFVGMCVVNTSKNYL